MTGQADSPRRSPPGLAAVVVGAGRTGQALVRDLQDHEEHGLRPVAVLGDTELDNTNLGDTDLGDTDLGDTDATATDLARLITRHEAEAVVLAIPDLPAPRFRHLADTATRAGAVVRYLPWYAVALHRAAKGSDLLPLDIRALIDSPAPHVVSQDVKEIVTGKRVLVTGAGGALGSEFSRQLHAFNPSALFLLDSDEQSLLRLRTDIWGDELTTDLRDREQTNDLFRRFRPELVVHAAGRKQASVLERRPSLGVKANILSTDNLVRAAAKHGAERFVHISTDADPASMLGATQRVAEAIVLGAASKTGKKHHPGTAFAAVRIGDALDARASLLTTLPAQIRAGGPVTITHPDATRCFATVEESVALALEAGRMATGGELFTLDLGEPMRITEVIARFTRHYKLPEVPIRYVGTRQHAWNREPAERIPTAQPQIFTVPVGADPAEYAHLPEWLDKLYRAADKNRDPKVRQMLAKHLRQ